MIQLCAVTEDWTFFVIVISEVPTEADTIRYYQLIRNNAAPGRN